MNHIYLDHAATTPVAKEVTEAMQPLYTEIYGNPSSIHALGRNARFYVDEARRTIAHALKVKETEVIFTSSGTEANNLAVIGVAYANKNNGNHIITSVQEHKSILNSMQFLEENGFTVTYLPVDESGRVKTEHVTDALTSDTILVSIMHANNETGVLQPIHEIKQALANHQAYFHTDAVQSFSHVEFTEPIADLISISAHKINGPKGIGCLYVNENVKINPILFGGSQERKRRAGTENVAQIVGFEKSVKRLKNKRAEETAHDAQLKNTFIDRLTEANIEFHVNGLRDQSIPSIVNIYFPGIEADIMLTNLDMNGIAAASGSACQAGSFEPSYVIEAMYGKESKRANQSIRFSFGETNTTEEMIQAADIISDIIKRLKG